MTDKSATATRRSLRLSVPAVTYAEIERLARQTGTPITEAALFVIGFGLATVDVITDPDHQAVAHKLLCDVTCAEDCTRCAPEGTAS